MNTPGLLFTVDQLTALAGGKAVTDVACPLCGPDRKEAGNRKRPVLRLWSSDSSFISFHCVRCGAAGHVLDQVENKVPVDSHRWKHKSEEQQNSDAEGRSRRTAGALDLWRPTRRIHAAPGGKATSPRAASACPLIRKCCCAACVFMGPAPSRMAQRRRR